MSTNFRWKSFGEADGGFEIAGGFGGEDDGFFAIEIGEQRL